MRFAYSIKQKMKIAVLLFCIMACTLLIRFLEDKSVKSMNESFVSMYNDRLIPATDLFYVAENAYLKKSLFEDALYGPDQLFDAASLKAQLGKLNVSIDSLIDKYSKTFLVKQEKEQLEELKKDLESTVGVENKMLSIATTQGIGEARKLYSNEGRDSSNKTIKKLSELMSIQKQIGEELIKDSAFMVSGNKLYSTFQVVLAIVIGILIVGIVFTSNVVKITNEKFNLN
ncbi:MAG: MCP four helix bundle domain-containing protein [Candidatus Pedobacter colombiensis]|uniref:MCP four helix bundle domain-containing protein n=1 Tax=Candidatus Pedobacter colombiensis TaxID=3121371 RepID=A0AAJ6B8M3_9SPHI|nr:MCP four helix bundle domain-containing protein [Pedobacter sp.]WEK20656.1 MAG: MCP four helix bundle domain-containing protein [Pedobacter sp.]